MMLVGPWLLAGAAVAIASCAAGTQSGETGGATASNAATSSSSTQATGSSGSSGGGASTSAGSTTTGTGGQGGTGGCTTAAGCPAPANACSLATCTAGACGTAPAAAGTVITKDTPADCKATVCDGTGNTMPGVDASNVPAPTNPCLVGTCSATGTPGTAPAAAGTACTGGQGKVCDGAGACAPCLHDADCVSGQTCLPTHTCVPATCLDGMRDESETDVDCGGGVCPGCAAGKACTVDHDCTSMGCDTASLTCVVDPCTDHHRDGDETDVDCGGSCPMPCGSEQGCAVDADCLSDACDGVSLTCDDDQCSDHRRDGDESDVDCGGDICGVPCAIGKACLVDTDCVVPYACDGVSFTCVTNQCLDDQQDGNETDVDCGGGNNCLRCKVGMKCLSATDCRAGFTCTAGNTCG